MGRGRQKGQVKRMSTIKDPIISPFEIYVEEDQFVLIDTTKDKPLSYHGSLDNAVKIVVISAKHIVLNISIC